MRAIREKKGIHFNMKTTFVYDHFPVVETRVSSAEAFRKKQDELEDVASSVNYQSGSKSNEVDCCFATRLFSTEVTCKEKQLEGFFYKSTLNHPRSKEHAVV